MRTSVSSRVCEWVAIYTAANNQRCLRNGDRSRGGQITCSLRRGAGRLFNGMSGRGGGARHVCGATSAMGRGGRQRGGRGICALAGAGQGGRRYAGSSCSPATRLVQQRGGPAARRARWPHDSSPKFSAYLSAHRRGPQSCLRPICDLTRRNLFTRLPRESAGNSRPVAPLGGPNSHRLRRARATT